MGLNIIELHKVHFSVSLVHLFSIQEGQNRIPIDFSLHYYIMDFSPSKTKYNNALYTKTVFHHLQGKGSVCVLG